MHTYVPPNSIFNGPITNLLSVLCIVIEILARAHTKGAETFIGRLTSDGVASMGVKGLKNLPFLTSGHIRITHLQASPTDR